MKIKMIIAGLAFVSIQNANAQTLECGYRPAAPKKDTKAAPISVIKTDNKPAPKKLEANKAEAANAIAPATNKVNEPVNETANKTENTTLKPVDIKVEPAPFIPMSKVKTGVIAEKPITKEDLKAPASMPKPKKALGKE